MNTAQRRERQAEQPRLPLTALVASHNEAAELDRCLASLGFCDEVIVIDIDSHDATAQIAEAHGARVIRHAYVPIAERARVEIAAQARHDWLVFTDPDEEIPAALVVEVERLLASMPDDVALVWAPIRFLFNGSPLRGTIWGGTNRRRFLVRRDGVDLTGTVFGGTHVRAGYRMIELPFSEETAIRHYWVSGYGDWIAKHRRYLELHRTDRADAGEVTGLRAVTATPFRAFRKSFVTDRGYLDGATGLALSVLWAWFSTASSVLLLRELRRRKRAG